jgi:cholesterol oxidase
MYVCDGSVVAANLGVNPSLTITALTERAMTYIQPASQTDWNDPAEEAAPIESLSKPPDCSRATVAAN